MKRARLLLASLLAFGAPACSALLSEKAEQCTQDRDCAELGFDSWLCNTSRHVCVRESETPSGTAGKQSNHAGSDNAGGTAAGSGAGGNNANTAGKASAGAGNGGVDLGGSGGNPSGGVAGKGGDGGSAGTAGAPPKVCDTTACSAAKGTCTDDVCVITCDTPTCAPHCPAGMPCQVVCSNKDSCNGGLVDCGGATTCDVSCADSACLKGVSCAGKSCKVTCSGQGACSTLPITCNAAACTITCPGLQSCKELSCGSAAQTCNLECQGVQSCGTLLGSMATNTTVACTAKDTCQGAKDLCCTGGAACSGNFKPACN